MSRPSDRTCPTCSARFRPRVFNQTYCTAKCNQAGENREMLRAKRLYRALYHWRNSRPIKADGPEALERWKDDFRYICREAASWAEEDRAEGRPKPPRHRHDLDRGYQRRPLAGLRARRMIIVDDLEVSSYGRRSAIS